MGKCTSKDITLSGAVICPVVSFPYIRSTDSKVSSKPVCEMRGPTGPGNSITHCVTEC